MTTIRHKGVDIVAVKTVRYEVRNSAGKAVKKCAKLTTAKAWVDGYVKALQRYPQQDQKAGRINNGPASPGTKG